MKEKILSFESLMMYAYEHKESFIEFLDGFGRGVFNAMCEAAKAGGNAVHICLPNPDNESEVLYECDVWGEAFDTIVNYKPGAAECFANVLVPAFVAVDNHCRKEVVVE